MRNDIDKLDWGGERWRRKWLVAVNGMSKIRVCGDSLVSALYQYETRWHGACVVYLIIESSWDSMTEDERREFGDDYCEFHFQISCSDADRAKGDVDLVLEAAMLSRDSIELDAFTCPMCGGESEHAVVCGQCGDPMCSECFTDASGEWPCCRDPISALDLLSISTD